MLIFLFVVVFALAVVLVVVVGREKEEGLDEALGSVTLRYIYGRVTYTCATYTDYS